MKYILIILLILLPVSVTAQMQRSSVIQRNIHIVYITPANETFSDEEKQYSYNMVVDAIHWWETLSPISTTLTITGTDDITTTDDIYTNTLLELNSKVTITGMNPVITIFIVDNSNTGKQLMNRTSGLSWIYFGVILVTLSSGASGITHELGHVAYILPDIFGGCSTVDIMCDDYSAYIQHTIGCKSLENLGHPCSKIHIPVVR